MQPRASRFPRNLTGTETYQQSMSFSPLLPSGTTRGLGERIPWRFAALLEESLAPAALLRRFWEVSGSVEKCWEMLWKPSGKSSGKSSGTRGLEARLGGGPLRRRTRGHFKMQPRASSFPRNLTGAETYQQSMSFSPRAPSGTTRRLGDKIPWDLPQC